MIGEGPTVQDQVRTPIKHPIGEIGSVRNGVELDRMDGYGVEIRVREVKNE